MAHIKWFLVLPFVVWDYCIRPDKRLNVVLDHLKGIALLPVAALLVSVLVIPITVLGVTNRVSVEQFVRWNQSDATLARYKAFLQERGLWDA